MFFEGEFGNCKLLYAMSMLQCLISQMFHRIVMTKVPLLPEMHSLL